MHHLSSGVRANHFLPVIAEINGQKFYHTAHPPLLHIIYAGLYKIFGVHEWVTRAFSLALLIASIFLLGSMTGARNRLLFWLIALFNPLSFRLGMTTNYELLTISSICLLIFSFEQWRKQGKAWTVPALGLAMALVLLSDWPAYLAAPALLLVNFRDKKSRLPLAAIFLLEAAFLALLLAYEKSVAGEIALFAHGQTRSNPYFIFQPSSYRELANHFSWVVGWPALILIAAALFKFLVKSVLEKPEPVHSFWLCFLVLLWLSAANLTSRHFVYLLYFFPASALLLSRALSSLKPKYLAAAVVLICFILPDYTGFKTRDARAYYLAQKLKDFPQARLAFSSAALGTLYFYDKIETVVPVSRESSETLGRIDFDLMLLDRESPEVSSFLSPPERAGYRLEWSFPDMVVLLKNAESGPAEKYLAAKISQAAGNDWQSPTPEVVWMQHKPWYGLKQPPGRNEISRLNFDADGSCLSFKPAIHHAPVAGKGDGAGFEVMGRNEAGNALLYSRFLKKGAAMETEIKTGNLKSVSLITNAGPRGDFSFDDAYWLEAESGSNCGPRERQ